MRELRAAHELNYRGGARLDPVDGPAVPVVNDAAAGDYADFRSEQAPVLFIEIILPADFINCAAEYEPLALEQLYPGHASSIRAHVLRYGVRGLAEGVRPEGHAAALEIHRAVSVHGKARRLSLDAAGVHRPSVNLLRDENAASELNAHTQDYHRIYDRKHDNHSRHDEQNALLIPVKPPDARLQPCHINSPNPCRSDMRRRCLKNVPGRCVRGHCTIFCRAPQ